MPRIVGSTVRATVRAAFTATVGCLVALGVQGVDTLAWACSPAPPDAQSAQSVFMWPAESAVLPPGPTRLWFKDSGSAHLLLTRSGGQPSALTLVAADFSEDHVFASPSMPPPTLAYADVQLEAGVSYDLDWEPQQPGFIQRRQFSTGGAPGPSVDLSSAAPYLVFQTTGEPPEGIFDCGSESANELAILYVRPPPGAVYVLARASYPSDGSVTPASAQFIDPSVDDLKFTFWGADLGQPCIQLEAYDSSGTLQDSQEICDVDVCRTGVKDAIFPRDFWLNGGRGDPCSSGCVCAQGQGPTSGGLLLLLGLLWSGRFKRKP